MKAGLTDLVSFLAFILIVDRILQQQEVNVYKLQRKHSQEFYSTIINRYGQMSSLTKGAIIQNKLANQTIPKQYDNRLGQGKYD